MTSDPIIGLFSIVFRRAMLFILLSASLACGLWCWLLISRFNVPVHDLIDWVRAGWTPTDSKVPAVFLSGALTIGVLTTSVIFLLIGKWWKKRGDVHRRGARLDGGGM